MREELDPSDAVGFHVAGHLAYAALVRAQSAGAERCKTDIYEFEVGQEGYRQLNHFRLAGDECFTAAGFDIPNKSVYLSSGGEDGPALYVADLTEAPPRPKRMFALPATELFFEATGRRLFAAERESGRLWSVDVDEKEPQARLVADQLGWPVALGFGRQVQQLYVTDAKNQRIWALDCSRSCGEPEVFYQSESLENPTTLSVALDGTIWLGDLKAQTLRTITPDGNVDRTIYSLSGARASPMAPAGDPTVEGTSPP